MQTSELHAHLETELRVEVGERLVEEEDPRPPQGIDQSKLTQNYTDEALEGAVDLAIKYITNRFLPDKAIDVIDEAGARLRLRTMFEISDLKNILFDLVPPSRMLTWSSFYIKHIHATK